VGQLAGKPVETRGEVKEYDERAEIILDNAKQLGGEATQLPPLQKMSDVEQKGHFSARKKKEAPSLRGRRVGLTTLRPDYGFVIVIPPL